MNETFICEDCKKEKPSSENSDSDLDVCYECLEYYENVTGHCSAACRIRGKCDQSC